MGIEIRHGRRDFLRAIAAASLLGRGMARADDPKNAKDLPEQVVDTRRK